MADRLIKTETLQDIADAIREKRETTEGIDPANYAAEIRSIVGTEEVETYDDAVTVDESATPTFQEDYEEGRADGAKEGYKDGYAAGSATSEGYDIGYAAGIEQGKKAEYDAFWDAYQDNGNRTAYSYGFAGSGWTEATFKPKYNIVAKETSYMFAGMRLNLDFVKFLEDLGVTLSFSGATAFTGTFNAVQFTRIGEIDATKATSLTSTFSSSTRLVTIDELKVSENTRASSAFGGCSSLENIVIKGTIGQNGFSWNHSTKLTKDSITSIVNALSTTTSGLTVTFSGKAVDTAFEERTPEGEVIVGRNSDAWKKLKNDHLNWSFSLA